MTDYQDMYQNVCQRCKHIELGNKIHIEQLKLDLDSGVKKCVVCYKGDNLALGLVKTTKCASCKMVWRDDQPFKHKPNCETLPKNPIKITYPQRKTVPSKKDQIDMDQSFNILRLRGEKQIAERELMEIENHDNLQVIADSLKKEPESKPKEFKFNAVQ